jgi:hypothetical protein
MTVNDELGMMWKEAAVIHFKVLLKQFLEELNKTTKDLDKDG